MCFRADVSKVATLPIANVPLCVPQVDLKFPKIVSEGAKDLISKLLRHNPINRLPLRDVLEHPYVKTNSRRVLPPVCNAVKH